jgi:hypothetical protein
MTSGERSRIWQELLRRARRARIPTRRIRFACGLDADAFELLTAGHAVLSAERERAALIQLANTVDCDLDVLLLIRTQAPARHLISALDA